MIARLYIQNLEDRKIVAAILSDSYKVWTEYDEPLGIATKAYLCIDHGQFTAEHYSKPTEKK